VKWPQGLLRGALGVVLVGAGLTIMNKADTDLVPWVVAGASLAVIALFVVQIALRKEVEHDPEEQELLHSAAAITTNGGETTRPEAVDGELASRSGAPAQPAHASAED
jgi:hypothetical protein